MHFNCELFLSLGKNYVFSRWELAFTGTCNKGKPQLKMQDIKLMVYFKVWEKSINARVFKSYYKGLWYRSVYIPTGRFGLVTVLSLSYNRWYHHTRSGNHRTLSISYRFLHPPYFNVSGCPRVQSIDIVRNLSSVTLLTKLETAR